MQISRDATGYKDDLGYLYVALALVFAMVLRARRRGSQAPAIGRSANLHK
jgi:hypothetical protein